MSKRIEIVSTFYNEADEDSRLNQSRHGQLEQLTTMNFIHQYAKKGAKLLEIGAGTGRYSIALAKEGFDVTALELVEHNLEILRNNSKGIKNIHCFQGDALNLNRLSDNEFDVTMLFGPMYHLYDIAEVQRALDEAIRVTKEDGVLIIAFLSAYAILFNNYFQGNLQDGMKENFTNDYRVKHFEEQLFTGYDIEEFERLFAQKSVQHLKTVAVDSVLELAEGRSDFCMSEEDFNEFAKYHMAICEKRELLGCSSHLLYICKKK